MFFVTTLRRHKFGRHHDHHPTLLYYGHQTLEPTIFAFTTCTIWLARNNLIFKTVSTSLASIDHIIISHAIDFTYISGQALVKAHLRAIRLISWTPLTNEFIKHNT